MKLLIVEDEEDLRCLLREIAKVAGYTVFEAATGTSAVETARNVYPDVILMDVNLPEMDGWSAMKAIRETVSLHNVPIIFCSASHEASLRHEKHPPPHSSFLLKPFTVEELLVVLRHHSDGNTGQ
jgi:CheY-like chemotaxis protein